MIGPHGTSFDLTTFSVCHRPVLERTSHGVGCCVWRELRGYEGLNRRTLLIGHPLNLFVTRFEPPRVHSRLVNETEMVLLKLGGGSRRHYEAC